jgi:hypothetical protein
MMAAQGGVPLEVLFAEMVTRAAPPRLTPGR